MNPTLGITSRQNPLVQHLRKLGSDSDYRSDCGEFLGIGSKLLQEAESAGISIGKKITNRDLTGYIAGMKSAPDVVFSAFIPAPEQPQAVRFVLALEDVQDPGNVGTMLRSAYALGVDNVALIGNCADIWQPAVLRAAMGAAFKLFITNHLPENVPTIAAVIDDRSIDVRSLPKLDSGVLIIGNEGHGLRKETIFKADYKVKIPIRGESLNAGAAAAILLWEIVSVNSGQ
ncbi:MAG: RNA methyltransferase [Oscillospiraceae bacterium]|jgi:TrmH family RNA methyltransferase|nr:RNA methyltransferase [Oscillospiraceae bacterium]